MKKKKREGLSEEDIVAYGRLRGSGFSKEEAADRLVISSKIKKIAKRGRFG